MVHWCTASLLCKEHLNWFSLFLPGSPTWPRHVTSTQTSPRIDMRRNSCHLAFHAVLAIRAKMHWIEILFIIGMMMTVSILWTSWCWLVCMVCVCVCVCALDADTEAGQRCLSCTALKPHWNIIISTTPSWFSTARYAYYDAAAADAAIDDDDDDDAHLFICPSVIRVVNHRW